MIKIEEGKLTIIIDGISPADYVSDLMKSLAGIVSHQEDSFRQMNAAEVDEVMDFLQWLLPNEEQILKGYGTGNNG